MRLRGINFGYVLNASGARNFDGSGWWYHRFMGWAGLDYTGTTFVAKTTTLHPRQGNMALDGLQPLHAFPDCVWMNWRKGIVLNAVGLSGPGAEWLLKKGVWHKQEAPFFLSFMSVASTRLNRLAELLDFVQLLKKHLPFQAPVGLQVNFSCPNVGLDPKELAGEMLESMAMVRSLDIPIVAKVNATFPIESVFDLDDNDAFDALSVSNTIPWGKLPDRIAWSDLFGTTESPLAKYGGGGLSGAPLLPIVTDWIAALRNAGFRKPIIGGGGILSAHDAERMLESGASAIELGSVSMLRPWRVRSIVRHVHRRLGNGAST